MRADRTATIKDLKVNIKLVEMMIELLKFRCIRGLRNEQ